MKKIIFLSFVTACVVFTAYAEEAKTIEKIPAKKNESVKSSAPFLSPKKPKPAECVAPAKPATPAEPAKPADAAKPAAPAEAAKSVEAADTARPVKPAQSAKAATPTPGTCPQEAEKPAAKLIERIDHEE